MNITTAKIFGKKTLLFMPFLFVVFAGALFLVSDILKYREAWMLLSLAFLPIFLVTVYFFRCLPEFPERRSQFRKKEFSRQKIVEFADIFFFTGFVIAGLDYRYSWSFVPVWLIILSDVIILFSYYFVFLAFRENTVSARTVEVLDGQQVVRSGPYAIIRHPMYAGIILMYIFIPLALGSFWTVLFFIPVYGMIIAQIFKEEDVLRRDLPGYIDYCREVPYRLFPYIW